MKKFSIAILLILFCIPVFSQTLEGEWIGFYKEQSFKNEYSIKLHFTLNADSSYTIYSTSNGKDQNGLNTVFLCEVICKHIDVKSLVLEETKVITPFNAAPSCPQTMYLKIKKRKKVMMLEGTWNSDAKECALSGEISFSKKNVH